MVILIIGVVEMVVGIRIVIGWFGDGSIYVWKIWGG